MDVRAMQAAADRRLKRNLDADVTAAMRRIQNYTATELDEVREGLRDPEHVVISRAAKQHSEEVIESLKARYRAMGVALNVAVSTAMAALEAFADGISGRR